MSNFIQSHFESSSIEIRILNTTEQIIAEFLH